MIKKQEIMDLAWEFSLSAHIIEKDYVLGWLLAGINHHPALFPQWIFKGGTCLKKCYFETYRFSEDLDYTLIEEKQLNEKFLVECFKQIAHWIYEATGIEIPLDTIRFEIYQNSEGKTSVEGRIGYIGPLQRRNSLARIKLDLTTNEILVLKPVPRNVHHPYSDKPKEDIKAYCYSFPEIFAEKMRALSERARPRDLYDVIHLYRHTSLGEQPTSILEVLKKKCEYKLIPTPTMDLIENHSKLHELEAEWSNMLAHQLPILPPREQFWKELPNLFNWLHGNLNKDLKELIPLPIHENIDFLWQPSNMIQAWHMKIPCELIRYAGANHLCVVIEYEGKRSLIEPYDIKRTQTEKFLLIAIIHDTEEWHSYHIDRIQKIELTQISFEPTWQITLTPFL